MGARHHQSKGQTVLIKKGGESIEVTLQEIYFNQQQVLINVRHGNNTKPIRLNQGRLVDIVDGAKLELYRIVSNSIAGFYYKAPIDYKFVWH